MIQIVFFYIIFREEQQWSESVNTDDSEDEREQVYKFKKFP